MIDKETLVKAEKGDIQSMREVGEKYYLERCFSLAFYWLLRAAKKGDAQAMFFVASFYRKGVGTQINVKKSNYWLKKGAKNNSKQAIVSLAKESLCLEGLKNGKRTLEICKKAAKCDSGMGEYFLGLCYFNGIGVSKNIEKARYHFTMSAVSGIDFAREQLSDKVFNIAMINC